jgi:hypothetical protein
MKEHSINNLNNFIGGWYIDESLCDEILNFTKTNPNMHIGESYPTSSRGSFVNLDIKDSMDGRLDDNAELYNKYAVQLQCVLDKYIEMYPYCNNDSAFSLTQKINLQYYPPGGGYKVFHCERGSALNEIISSRHLVFMTYLNNITDAGETEFYHQGIKVKPEKGLTLIWGADWTFYHRGIPSPSQEKYIVTGWFNYINT